MVEHKRRYFEDYVAGEVYEFGDEVVTESEILDFARRFDPQTMHLDPVAARASVYGGLIASGWHTAAMMMRMMVDHFVSPLSSLGSPGMDAIRWLRPVRPGDRLRARLTILQTRRSVSRPDTGILHQSVEVLNQNGEVVMTSRGVGMYRTRPVAD